MTVPTVIAGQVKHIRTTVEQQPPISATRSEPTLHQQNGDIFSTLRLFFSNTQYPYLRPDQRGASHQNAVAVMKTTVVLRGADGRCDFLGFSCDVRGDAAEKY